MAECRSGRGWCSFGSRNRGYRFKEISDSTEMLASEFKEHNIQTASLDDN